MSAKLIHISDLGKLFRKLFDFNPDIAKPVQSARSVGFLNPTASSISISNKIISYHLILRLQHIFYSLFKWPKVIIDNRDDNVLVNIGIFMRYDIA